MGKRRHKALNGEGQSLTVGFRNHNAEDRRARRMYQQLAVHHGRPKSYVIAMLTAMADLFDETGQLPSPEVLAGAIRDIAHEKPASVQDSDTVFEELHDKLDQLLLQGVPSQSRLQTHKKSSAAPISKPLPRIIEPQDTFDDQPTIVITGGGKASADASGNNFATGMADLF